MPRKAKMKGRLIVFEGPDGVGKTTLAHRLVEYLTSRGRKVIYASSPGCETRGLGRLVYDLHKDNEQFVSTDPTSLQMLHVAAHIDSLNRKILPSLKDGNVVVMDRFWWSTLAYGYAFGAKPQSLNLMMEIEKLHWNGRSPDILFYVDSEAPFRTELTPEIRALVQERYRSIMEAERPRHRIRRISVVRAHDSLPEVLREFDSVENDEPLRQLSLPGSTIRHTGEPHLSRGFAYSTLRLPKPTTAYDLYWKFAAERQEIFYKRFHNAPPPWTTDRVLMKFKFTNAYRASDRTSQFLIRNVIYSGDQHPQELLFRILLFKLFNKIETWRLLEAASGTLTVKRFDFDTFDQVLTQAMSKGVKIYSAAYIMPSGGKNGDSKKHRNHLRVLQSMLTEELAERLLKAKSLAAVFTLLRGYPTIGPFLGYQYAIDLNYSAMLNFSEMDFVVPGPGARDGIRKCFYDTGELSESDIIRFMADRQSVEFDRLGLTFRTLWGRPLQLIDCQNLFCEVDKYSRNAHPEMIGITGRTRIKQVFRMINEPIDFWYPPKWGLNEKMLREMGKSHDRISG